MENQFKIGDKVYISPTSEYYSYNDSDRNPIHTIGEIIDIPDKLHRIFTHQVMWDNGFKNIYAVEDLILATTVDNTERNQSPTPAGVTRRISRKDIINLMVEMGELCNNTKVSQYKNVAETMFDNFINKNNL